MVIPGFLDLDQSKVVNLFLWCLKLWDVLVEQLLVEQLYSRT